MNLPDGTEYKFLLDGLTGRKPWAVAELDEPPSSPVRTPLAALPPLTTLTEVIDGHAPQRIALSDGLRTVTYAELRRRTTALAARLSEHGVAPGDLVLLAMERGMTMVETMVALWRMRAAFLAVDPASPESWRERTARLSGAAVCLATSGRPAVDGVRRVDVDLLDLTDGRYDGPPGAGADLAYVIRTSGSSGVPKLAMAEHAGVLNLLDAVRREIRGLGADAVVVHMTPPYFDMAIFDLLLALGTGSRLEIVEGLAEPSVLTERAITHAILPAPLVRTMRPADHPSLRMLMTGGDVCRPATARMWAPHVQFINAYGPSETSILISMHTVDALPDGDTVPLGRPVPGVEMTIVDEDLRPVADGERGEILIGGIAVGRGYLGDAEETARRFVIDPVTGGRAYRTGDIGRIDAGGLVEFLGRKDFQAKIRGYRVEPGEVEGALARLPGVHDAIVLADSSVDGGRLLGYVRADGVTGQELRKALSDTLPAYLVPNVISVVADWPLTENGKIDRARLPRPHRGDAQLVPADTPVEHALAAIAAGLLDMDRISVGDSIADLGGDSLLAMRFVARVRSELGAAVGLSAVIRGDTIAELAAALIATEDGGPRPAPPGSAIVPSYSQERVWLTQRMHPDSVAYHAQCVLLFDGELDVSALEASLTDLLRRHDVLRSRLPFVDGVLRCVIDEPAPVKLPITDLDGQSDMDTEIAEIVRTELAAPFSLEAGGLIRWRLVRLSEGRHLLIHVEHHAVHDGWSFSVFLDDLVHGYLDFVRHGEVRRPPLPLQFHDFARWQRQWCGSADAHRQRAYWRHTLAGATGALALTSAPRPLVRDLVGAAPRLDLDGELAVALERLGRGSGASLHMTMLAAYYVLLHRHSGQEDILVGAGMAGRRWQATENMMGMFVNTVVLRAKPVAGMTFRALLAHVREVCLAAYDHQDLPFEEVIAGSGVPRVPGYNPLVQVAFSFHDTPTRTFDAAPVRISALPGLGNGSAKFDFNVIVMPRWAGPGRTSGSKGNVLHVPRSDVPVPPAKDLAGITVSWEYDTSLFSSEFIAGVLREYRDLLREAVADPEFALGAVSRPESPRSLPARPPKSGSVDGGAEAALLAVVRELLGVTEIDRHDNFYELGGDSLMIIKFTARASDLLGRRIPAIAMFRDPTVNTALAAAGQSAPERRITRQARGPEVGQ